jgi:hypothetical protein
MLLELISVAYLLLQCPDGVADWLPRAGLTLLAVVWCSTFFLQVPGHEKLASRFSELAEHPM